MVGRAPAERDEHRADLRRRGSSTEFSSLRRRLVTVRRRGAVFEVVGSHDSLWVDSAVNRRRVDLDFVGFAGGGRRLGRAKGAIDAVECSGGVVGGDAVVVGSLATEAFDRLAHFDVHGSRADASVGYRHARSIGSGFAVFEAIFGREAVRVDRAVQDRLARGGDGHPFGDRDGHRHRPVRGPPAGRSVIADIPLTEIGGVEAGFAFDGAWAVFAVGGVEEAVPVAGTPKGARAGGAKCARRKGLNPGHQRGCNAGSAEELPARLAVAVVDRHRSRRACNGRYVGDGPHRTAGVLLPRRLCLEFTTAAARTRPGALRPASCVGGFLEAGPTDGDRVRRGRRVLNSVSPVPRGEEGRNARVVEIVVFTHLSGELFRRPAVADHVRTQFAGLLHGEVHVVQFVAIGLHQQDVTLRAGR